jgi:exodeoxyribonuclease III
MMPPLTLLSWNVNGARAIYKAGFMAWLAETAPDILCLQETRAEPSQIPAEMREPPGYHAFWHASSRKKGHSGVGLLTREAPVDVSYGIGRPEFDDEGRTIVAEYVDFTLINCYFPNGGRDLERVPYKLAFYDAFLEFIEGLRSQGRQVIFCGDINTAHREIDLARPRQNLKTTGFLPEERAWMDRLVASGYVDIFRQLYPELVGQYTWWLQWAQARERNIGWRIDYFFAAAEVLPRVTDAFIWPQVRGSDHCPVGIRLAAMER